MTRSRIRGETRTYPFVPTTNVLTINPSPHCTFRTALLDGHFTAKQWVIREAATHAKSKIYGVEEIQDILAAAQGTAAGGL